MAVIAKVEQHAGGGSGGATSAFQTADQIHVQPKPSLVSKLAEVMKAVGRVPKTGRNPHFKYAFVEENVLLDHVRQHLADRNIIMFPDLEHQEQVGDVTILRVAFRFVDGDSGEQQIVRVTGYGKDGQDKGPYKALTGATKYALMKTFLIPTGDDPEYDAGWMQREAQAGPKAAPGPSGGPSTTSSTSPMKPSGPPSEMNPAPRAPSSTASAPPKAAQPAPQTGSTNVEQHPPNAGAPPTAEARASPAAGGAACAKCETPIGEDVRAYSQRNWKVNLCRSCQAKTPRPGGR